VYIQRHNPNRINIHLYIQNRNPNHINKSWVYTQGGCYQGFAVRRRKVGKRSSAVYIQRHNPSRISSRLYVQNRNPNPINESVVYTREGTTDDLQHADAFRYCARQGPGELAGR